MNWLLSICKFLPGSLPDRSDDLVVWKFVENTVTAKQNKIVAIFYFKRLDVGLSRQYVLITSVLLFLGFDVSKGSTDAQSPWENSNRPKNYLILKLPCFLILYFDYTVRSKTFSGTWCTYW